MRFVLIGFMGAGKSSVGNILAQRLSVDFVEMDEMIVARSGLSSIPEIFELKGEQGFRDLETSLAKDLAGRQDAVISTGGGIIFRDENLLCLGGRDSVIVYLRTAFSTAAARIGRLEDRPLFRNQVTALELYQRRAPVYEKWGQLIVDTDDKTPEQLAAEIIAKTETPSKTALDS